MLKTIALFPNEKKKDSFDLARKITTFFHEKGKKIVAEEGKAEEIGALPLSAVPPKEIDLLIAMGGDGTLLRIAHYFSWIDAPILGINLGHLGFMADIPTADVFPTLEELLAGAYRVENRSMLQTTSEGISSPLYAVNDIVLHRAKNYSLVELVVHLNGTYVNTFLADGLVISTPTGSTAYSLAAGGPILSPTLDAIVLSPICPHTISNRPLVLTADCTITIEYTSPYDEIDVRADGLNAYLLKPHVPITIKRASRTFKLVKLHRHDYFSTLRKKLGWSGKLTES
ncbi:MAG: NAD(+)/NADH kinase [Verrucomicrobiota bacterium]|nr:NAD(+)/NADH kinase [Verrucomicrobiota bacterium]